MHSTSHYTSDFPHGKYGRDIRRAMGYRSTFSDVPSSTTGMTTGTSSAGTGLGTTGAGAGMGGYQQEIGTPGGYSSTGGTGAGTGYGGKMTSGMTGTGTEGEHQRSPGKVHGTFEKMTGGIQHGLGRMFGSPGMAMKGEEKRALGQMEIEAARARSAGTEGTSSGATTGSTAATGGYGGPLERERVIDSQGDTGRSASGYSGYD